MGGGGKEGDYGSQLVECFDRPTDSVVIFLSPCSFSRTSFVVLDSGGSSRGFELKSKFKGSIWTLLCYY